jgi:hypothetical protein
MEGFSLTPSITCESCVGRKLESFALKDVATAGSFASHVLFQHPDFCNRPTCLLFYTTW